MPVMIVAFISFFLFLAMGVPVFFSLGLISVIYLLLTGAYPITIIAQRMFTCLDSFILTAIPFFILAGKFMERGGISRRIVDFANCIVGWITGGLAHVNIVASMFFGGITGSAMADTSAIGAILIPAMNEAGYEKEFTAGVTSVSSTVGILIPPSIPMVIYGVAAGVSIGRLFLGGMIPGILVGVFLMITAYVISVRKKYPREPRVSFYQFLKVFKNSILALLMPVIILGGIVAGVVTATEASVVAVIYAFIISCFVYKEIKLSQVPRLIIEAGITAAAVTVIIGSASLFAWLITIEQIPQTVASVSLSLTSKPVFILLIMNGIFLVSGCFLDVASSILILTPIFLPLVCEMGMSPVHFGCMMVVNLGLGLSTPPVGGCLYVASGIINLPLERVARGAIPFVITGLAVLAIVTYAPSVSTYIPSLLMK